MKKTFKQWVKQDKDLDDFLSPGDYIDERLYNYIGEIIPPAYYSRDFIQGCDAIKNAECDGFLHQSISKCCLNQMNKHKGYKWMYLSDYEAQFNKSKNS